jgi:hypothetical protein
MVEGPIETEMDENTDAAKEDAETIDDQKGRTPNVVDVSKLVGQFPEPEASNALPDWAEIPADMQIPKGVQVSFLRFRAGWTMNPSLGERSCVVWVLTDLDEHVAHGRCKDNLNAAAGELAKQTIRVVDGVKVNWGARRGEPGNVDDFWRDIGPKCRSLVTRYWSQTHTMDAAEVSYFFEHCVAVRTMG